MELVTLQESTQRQIQLNKPIVEYAVSLVLGPNSDNMTEYLKVQLVKCILRNINCLEQLGQATLKELQNWLAIQAKE